MIRFRTQVTLVTTALVVATSVALGIALITVSTGMMRHQIGVMGEATVRVLVAQQEQKQRILDRDIHVPSFPGTTSPFQFQTPQNGFLGEPLFSARPSLILPENNTGKVPPRPDIPPEMHSETLQESPFVTDLREMAVIINATSIATVVDGKIQTCVTTQKDQSIAISASLVSEMWLEMQTLPKERLCVRDADASVLIMAPLHGEDSATKTMGLLVQLPQALSWQLVAATRTALCIIALAVILAAVAAAWVLSRSISKPLSELAITAGAYGDGALDIPAPVAGPAETRELGIAFNAMAAAMKEYIQNLQEATRRREQLESELRLAAALQRSLLPQPGLQRFGSVEVFGWSEAAEEVGGDFYDYCLVGSDKLLFVIGDATGKGIPAALLAAKCLSVLHALTEEYGDPAELLHRANALVSRQFKEDGHFVTVFLGIVDFSSGRFCYSRAGHNPPLLLDAALCTVTPLSDQDGLPLGVTAGGTFDLSSVEVKEGDTLLLYTDGITEATDGDTNFYGSARLASLFKNQGTTPLPNLCDSVVGDIKTFSKGMPLDDDCTLLLLRFHTPVFS